jgi:ribose/xylose/arabinose/galactoside ABC-type transport system permease subunit
VYTDRRTQLSILAFLGVLFLVLLLKAPSFFTVRNILDITVNTSYVAIAALGMMLVIVIGQIDVSVGAILAICCTITGLLSKQGVPTIALVGVAMGTGAFLGMMNGLLVALLRIHSIVVTLGTLSIFRGLLIALTQGMWISGLPDTLLQIGRGRVLGFPVPVLVAVLIFVLATWFLYAVPGGRSLFAVGSNREAARLSGINVPLIQIWAFAMNGALVGLAALIFAGRFGGIQSNTGQGFELVVITAVVVGGADIFGGAGTPLGTLLGALVISVIGTTLIFFNINAFWEQAVQGLFILFAVTFYALRSKRRGVHVKENRSGGQRKRCPL